MKTFSTSPDGRDEKRESATLGRNGQHEKIMAHVLMGDGVGAAARRSAANLNLMPTRMRQTVACTTARLTEMEEADMVAHTGLGGNPDDFSLPVLILLSVIVEGWGAVSRSLRFYSQTI